jgi:hypothetical protein
MDRYNDETPTWLDPEAVLADPRWHSIRERALAFVVAFQGWPGPALATEAAKLLERDMRAYATKNKQAIDQTCKH